MNHVKGRPQHWRKKALPVPGLNKTDAYSLFLGRRRLRCRVGQCGLDDRRIKERYHRESAGPEIYLQPGTC